MNNNCFNHDHMNATTICSSCGRSFCDECVDRDGDNYYCFAHGCRLAMQIERAKPKISQVSEAVSIPVTTSVFQRLLNFVTDILFFRLLMEILFNQVIFRLFERAKLNDYVLLGVEMLLLFMYYFIFESAFQRTPGKFLTNTYVVLRDGSKPGMAAIALRTISRFIPFEVFSFYGGTWWHDRFSKTMVINIH
jgi:hypothetical protein